MAEGMARRWPYNWYPGLGTATARTPSVVDRSRPVARVIAPVAPAVTTGAVVSAVPAVPAAPGIGLPRPYTAIVADSAPDVHAQSFPVRTPYLVGEPLEPMWTVSTRRMGAPAAAAAAQ